MNMCTASTGVNCLTVYTVTSHRHSCRAEYKFIQILHTDIHWMIEKYVHWITTSIIYRVFKKRTVVGSKYLLKIKEMQEDDEQHITILPPLKL